LKNVIGRIGTKIDRNSANEIFSTHPFPIAAAAIADVPLLLLQQNVINVEPQKSTFPLSDRAQNL